MAREEDPWSNIAVKDNSTGLYQMFKLYGIGCKQVACVNCGHVMLVTLRQGKSTKCEVCKTSILRPTRSDLIQNNVVTEEEECESDGLLQPWAITNPLDIHKFMSVNLPTITNRRDLAKSFAAGMSDRVDTERYLIIGCMDMSLTPKSKLRVEVPQPSGGGSFGDIASSAPSIKTRGSCINYFANSPMSQPPPLPLPTHLNHSRTNGSTKGSKRQSALINTLESLKLKVQSDRKQQQSQRPSMFFSPTTRAATASTIHHHVSSPLQLTRKEIQGLEKYSFSKPTPTVVDMTDGDDNTNNDEGSNESPSSSLSSSDQHKSNQKPAHGGPRNNTSGNYNQYRDSLIKIFNKSKSFIGSPSLNAHRRRVTSPNININSLDSMYSASYNSPSAMPNSVSSVYVESGETIDVWCIMLLTCSRMIWYNIESWFSDPTTTTELVPTFVLPLSPDNKVNIALENSMIYIDSESAKLRLELEKDEIAEDWFLNIKAAIKASGAGDVEVYKSLEQEKRLSVKKTGAALSAGMIWSSSMKEVDNSNDNENAEDNINNSPTSPTADAAVSHVESYFESVTSSTTSTSGSIAGSDGSSVDIDNNGTSSTRNSTTAEAAASFIRGLLPKDSEGQPIDLKLNFNIEKFLGSKKSQEYLSNASSSLPMPDSSSILESMEASGYLSQSAKDHNDEYDDDDTWSLSMRSNISFEVEKSKVIIEIEDTPTTSTSTSVATTPTTSAIPDKLKEEYSSPSANNKRPGGITPPPRVNPNLLPARAIEPRCDIYSRPSLKEVEQLRFHSSQLFSPFSENPSSITSPHILGSRIGTRQMSSPTVMAQSVGGYRYSSQQSSSDNSRYQPGGIASNPIGFRSTNSLAIAVPPPQSSSLSTMMMGTPRLNTHHSNDSKLSTIASLQQSPAEYHPDISGYRIGQSSASDKAPSLFSINYKDHLAEVAAAAATEEGNDNEGLDNKSRKGHGGRNHHRAHSFAAKLRMSSQFFAQKLKGRRSSSNTYTTSGDLSLASTLQKLNGNQRGNGGSSVNGKNNGPPVPPIPMAYLNDSRQYNPPQVVNHRPMMDNQSFFGTPEYDGALSPPCVNGFTVNSPPNSCVVSNSRNNDNSSIMNNATITSSLFTTAIHNNSYDGSRYPQSMRLAAAAAAAAGSNRYGNGGQNTYRDLSNTSTLVMMPGVLPASSTSMSMGGCGYNIGTNNNGLYLPSVKPTIKHLIID
ncbi:hypothetical protein H4219_003839 [Mycoemilia scoparia]|uniref:PH domain-containing protein n=1 Tax=Mycoemilia scoparia TaxID=417184 RepID=A0A9W7ZTZ5_9FUNG|nr:hypothetical protein H4219_003839 [Mycoemilia scoparia]